VPIWWLKRRLRGRAALGRDIRLGRGARIDVARGAHLVLGDAVHVGAGTRISVRSGTLHVADNVTIGERVDIVVHRSVTIAPHARINDWVSITDFEPDFADPERPIRLQGLTTREVTIGERAIVDHAANLTAGATVRPGARVQPHEVR
jgi:acetyltransferase-like isoleucine patch superfamily enzyme